MFDYWKDCGQVLVTGASGFLGQAICRKLQQNNVEFVGCSSQDGDLCKREETLSLFSQYKPNVVIHCAVQGGGIGWMRDHPVESGLDNLRINANVLEAAFLTGVDRFIGVSSACVYPRDCPPPFHESQVWDGYPEPTNGPYALSKRMMMNLGQAYHKQHNFYAVFPVLANLYGPGDHLSPERAHVVADLMIRCAKNPDFLVVWGTGNASREFLYIDDAVEGILACVEAPAGDIINVGSGQETPILKLAQSVIHAFEKNINIRLDQSKPDGQPRKVLDVGKAKDLLGWEAQTSLRNGLRKTAQWYLSQFC